MREISKWLGIGFLFCEDFNANAHVHVVYNQYSGIVDAKNFAIVDGNLPPRVAALAVEWVMMNHQDLQANWDIVRGGGANLITIPPLVQ